MVRGKTGYVEEAGLSDFAFEQQRRTFHNFGYGLDPTSNGSAYIGDVERAIQQKGMSM